MAQTLAAKRRESIRPDQELIGLGASNLAAAFSGGYPVTGGFAQSVVNFDAGAETPAAGAYTAIGIALASLFLTPLLFHLPTAVLAATIIVAVLSLVDLGALRRTWTFSRFDFAAMAGTIVVTLGWGVEAGIITGVAVSVLLHLWRTSRPHVAVLGQIPGTHHYSNVLRHDVVCIPEVLSLRIDESLYFANARAIEDLVQQAVAQRPQVRHVVLNCAAVNGIDASALESLELIMHRLDDAGIKLHLTEVKDPVMDRLARTDFVRHLSGHVFLSRHEALAELAPETTRGADLAARPAIDACAGGQTTSRWSSRDLRCWSGCESQPDRRPHDERRDDDPAESGLGWPPCRGLRPRLASLGRPTHPLMEIERIAGFGWWWPDEASDDRRSQVENGRNPHSATRHS